MKIAIEGCCHGDLDKIYATIDYIQQSQNITIDLLICCGDFEAIRNEHDLKCMNVPQKYLAYKDFHKYYSGEKVASVPTLFIGGNHEASNHMWELYYGGFAAPNIYYMGHSGVIRFNGLRIAGVSGIFKKYSFSRPYTEIPPYSDESIRSVYHTRSFEILKLNQLQQFDDYKPIDIMLSHDWPTNVTKHGNVQQLLRYKSHFRDDIERGELGSGPSEVLLRSMKPKYWFSAHLHCKFAALVPHQENNSETKFLALDKCLPKRDFLQVLEINAEEPNNNGFEYDPDWLSILRATNELLLTPYHQIDYQQRQAISKMLNSPFQLIDKAQLLNHRQWISDNIPDLKIDPNNFVAHAPARNVIDLSYDYTATDNPQTVSLLQKLQLHNYISRPATAATVTSEEPIFEKNEEEIEI